MIRVYKDSDWPQIVTIYDLSKPEEMKAIVDTGDIIPLVQDSHMLRYFFSSHIWVYEDEEKILGFAGRKKNIISWLFVHPNYRNKGIGRNLLNAVIKSWEGSLILNVTKDNTVAIALYSSAGFHIFEEFEGNMYGKKIPAVRMKL